MKSALKLLGTVTIPIRMTNCGMSSQIALLISSRHPQTQEGMRANFYRFNRTKDHNRWRFELVPYPAAHFHIPTTFRLYEFGYVSDKKVCSDAAYIARQTLRQTHAESFANKRLWTDHPGDDGSRDD